jgi:nuclear cap-binding protein subunit 2
MMQETTKEEEAPASQSVILPPPPRAADLQFTDDNAKKLYWDRSHYESPQAQMKALTQSATLYVGNLAFTTRSVHIRSHFSQLGRVKTIQMGMDRIKKSPCGFCFVEYYARKDAVAAVSLLSSTKLDGNVIRVELDAGFQPGRQYGRGRKGGQVRDDRRPEPVRKRQRVDSNVDEQPPDAVVNATSEYYGPGEDEDDRGEPSAKRRRM